MRKVISKWIVVVWLGAASLWGATYETIIEDFEDANLWSPVTTVGWWHLDEDGVYSYTTTQSPVYKGQYAMRLDYHKTAPFQLVGAYFDSINPRRNFSDYQILKIRVFGSVKLLVKMEDRNGVQANVGIKTALSADQWNELEFDYSAIKIDQTNIKNIFLFVAPDDSEAKGTMFIDHISLAKKNTTNLEEPKLKATGEGSADSGLTHSPDKVESSLEDGIPIVSAVDVAFDRQQNIYVVQRMGSFIFKYDVNGHYVTEYARLGAAVGDLNQPLSIAMNPDQTSFYVVDGENNRLQKWFVDGELDHDFGQKGVLTWRGDGKDFGRVKDVAVDQHGDIYVLDISDNTIWKYAHDGHSGQLFWKKQEKANFFLEPVALKIHNDYLYVVDEAAASIDQFDLQGKYVSSAKCLLGSKKFFIPSDCAFDPLTGICLVISSQKKGFYVFDKTWKYLGMSEIDDLGQLAFIAIDIREGTPLIFVGDHTDRKVKVLTLQDVQDHIK